MNESKSLNFEKLKKLRRRFDRTKEDIQKEKSCTDSIQVSLGTILKMLGDYKLSDEDLNFDSFIGSSWSFNKRGFKFIFQVFETRTLTKFDNVRQKDLKINIYDNNMYLLLEIEIRETDLLYRTDWERGLYKTVKPENVHVQDLRNKIYEDLLEIFMLNYQP
jgi:hypothetical protein